MVLRPHVGDVDLLLLHGIPDTVVLNLGVFRPLAALAIVSQFNCTVLVLDDRNRSGPPPGRHTPNQS